MDLCPALIADLDLLSVAIQDSGAEIQDSGGDLTAWLESFVTDLRKAIGSYLGLTMTMALDGQQVTFTVSERASDAGASLRIPLAAVTHSDAGSALVLYAAVPGAFVDLAADLAWALELDAWTLVLDEHLAVPAASNAVIGLREQTTINQAVGALLEHGHTPHSARTALRHLARTEGGSVPASAQRIMDDLRRCPPPEAA